MRTPTIADDRRLVTYRPGLLGRLLIAPFNMSYHAEHHLWMYVPYFNLPRLHALVAEAPEIEVRGSFGAFLWRFARNLPLGRAAAPVATVT